MNAELKDKIKSVSGDDWEWVVAQATKDLKTMSVDEYVKNILDKRLIGFDHPSYDKLRSKQIERDDYIVNPYEVEEGVVNCPKCHKNFVYSTVKQTRAADEPMTTVSFCVKCKHKWSQNG